MKEGYALCAEPSESLFTTLGTCLYVEPYSFVPKSSTCGRVRAGNLIESIDQLMMKKCKKKERYGVFGNLPKYRPITFSSMTLFFQRLLHLVSL